MVLILKQKQSSFSRWYQQNKERLSQRRKQRYAQDSEYRQRAVEGSRRRRRGESNSTTPPNDVPISFGQAAERIGVSGSTLHSWRRQKLFPEPKHHNGRLWFGEQQIALLRDLKEKVHGRRRWYMKTDRFKEVIAHVHDHWA
jgi:MerR HTH family regulatory protein